MRRAIANTMVAACHALLNYIRFALKLLLIRDFVYYPKTLAAQGFLNIAYYKIKYVFGLVNNHD